MYGNWSPTNGQVYTHYTDGQHQQSSGNGGQAYPTTSPPSNNYYGFAPTQSFPTQQSQLSGRQSYPTHDPRLTAQQTNQTLTALASARRLSPEYILESSGNFLPPTRNYSQQHPYNDIQQPHKNLYHEGNGGPAESGHGWRSVQSPIRAASTPPTSNSHHKTTDGHACSYCGRSFGRPSALKIHLAIHTGERAYVCPEVGCHRSFSVRSNMSRHIRNVHQIWPEGHQDDIDSGDEGGEK